MTKTIEEWRVELNDLVMKSPTDAAKKMIEMQTEIMIAFMAKYGLEANDCILCYQGNKFWVESKDHIKDWISVKDKLPEPHNWVLYAVLVYEEKLYRHQMAYYSTSKVWHRESEQDKPLNVMHWFPLPRFVP